MTAQMAMFAPPPRPKVRVRLAQADCLQALADVPDASVQLVFADLPYGVTANKWDCQIPLAPLWVQLRRVATAKAAFVFTATQPFATTLINSWPKGFRYDLVWAKSQASGFLNARRRPLRAHESVLVFARGRTEYNPQMVASTVPNRGTFGPRMASTNWGARKQRKTWTDNGTRHPSTVLSVPRGYAIRESVHPTQKPVALLEWLIRTYSNEGDTVLDPTMGSGTTGVACVTTGRNFVGIERDPAYFATAQRRLNEAQGG